MAIGRAPRRAGGVKRTTAAPCVTVALVGLLATSCGMATAPSGHSAVATTTDWPGYLAGPEHSSTSPSTAISVAKAAALVSGWHVAAASPVGGQPTALFTASPTVYQGTVYIGSNTGMFYAFNEQTGAKQWTANLGYVPKLTCGGGRGISSTASVVTDPVTLKPTVYVGGGDGYLYALDAATGSQVWKSPVALPSNTQNDYYNWSSPAVANGKIYYGITSQCDLPFVRGGLIEFDQATGQVLHTFYTVPAGATGGGVWTSPAVGADGNVYISTASATKGTHPGDTYSMVQLSPDLTRLAAWQVPVAQQVGDSDWGSSPTMFQADLGLGVPTEMVGACNKNGYFYAFRTDAFGAGPIWKFQVGVGTRSGVLACLSSAIWDGTRLFVPGNATTINGTSYSGSMRRLDPASGAVIWQTGLPAIVLGSPSINANGVIAAATYDATATDGVFLIDGNTGSIIKFYATGKEFAQPVFAGTSLFVATYRNKLQAYHP